MNKLLSSVKHVADNSDHVNIDLEAIDKYVADFRPATVDHWMKACPFEYRALSNPDDEIDRHFLQDAQAFCFWGYPSKWNIKYEGKQIDGWWALLATFQRAIESGTPILDGNYLANLDKTEAETLFAGEPFIPMFNERIEDFNQIGQYLVKNYGGRFHNYLQESPHDAIEFIVDLAQKFPTFDDVSNYKGQPVYFYKKAQLLVYQLATKLSNTKFGHIDNISELTGKADYKIPALLRKLGILVYDGALSKMVDNRVVLLANSPEEVEIRANMLWANHLICDQLSQHEFNVTAMDLNDQLWVNSQTKSATDKPYHLTLTTNY